MILRHPPRPAIQRIPEKNVAMTRQPRYYSTIITHYVDSRDCRPPGLPLADPSVPRLDDIPADHRAQGTHDEDASPGLCGCRRASGHRVPACGRATASGRSPDRRGRRSLHRRGPRQGSDQAGGRGRRCDPLPPVDARPGRTDSHRRRVACVMSNRPTPTSGSGWSTA